MKHSEYVVLSGVARHRVLVTYVCPNCRETILHWECSHGMMIVEQDGRTTYYKARCSRCGPMRISKTERRKLKRG